VDLISWFGGEVSRLAERDPARARRLLLTGYRANLLTLEQPLRAPSRPRARRYAEAEVMRVMIRALARPGEAALVSLFTPCELLFAAGVAPYSLEAVSGYLMGTRCETGFQQLAAERGVPETMCSFHRTFLGAEENGLLPAPRLIVYTSLACDGNMITFPRLREKTGAPCFFLDVPYEKSGDAVRAVAARLRELRAFLADVLGREVPEEALRAAVGRSRRSAEDYLRALAAARTHRLSGDATGEMYAAFLSHILLGSAAAERYFSLLARETEAAPDTRAKRLVWLHVVPYMQPAVRAFLNPEDRAVVTACELCYDSLFVPPAEGDDPYEFMARRLVYSGYNGGAEARAENALRAVRLTGADGAVVFAHWGCKATLGAAQLLRGALEAEGVPALVLDGDACCPANTGDGQTATRLEAFLEMLEARG
jgi:benzoyl-CoA reductase/2-hydroxyglutaryl-CoA dehydratase subunit BcrC/BadD/HgdB